MHDRTSPFLKGGRGSTDVAEYYYTSSHEAGANRHASFGGEDGIERVVAQSGARRQWQADEALAW
jgi:hypothetical protein